MRFGCPTPTGTRPWPALVATVAGAAATGRLAVSLACRRGYPAARPDGLGAAVAGTVDRPALVAGTLGVALLTLPAVPDRPWQGPLAVLATLGLLHLALRHVRRRLGGITGDVLGATVEAGVTLVCIGFLLGG